MQSGHLPASPDCPLGPCAPEIIALSCTIFLFLPIENYLPGRPVSPVSPCRPGEPSYPGGPWMPWGPGGPSILSPTSPRSPLSPRSPCGPGKPVEPGRPVKCLIVMQYVRNYHENLTLRTWHSNVAHYTLTTWFTRRAYFNRRRKYKNTFSILL